MATTRRSRTTRRVRAISRKKRPTSRTSRRHAVAKRAGAPKISRSRLQMLKDDLDRTRDAMTETVEKFWITPEHEIRQMLGRTQHKIGRVAETLSRAA